MIAIIPARGGSKGLPGKNIRSLSGKPLIAYTIEAAIQSRAVTRVVVSTDCHEIADVAKLYGAEVPFLRPDELSTDSANAIDVYVYMIEKLGDSMAQSGDLESIVVLLPTCPMRNAKDIDEAISIFKEKKADSVISHTEEAHPIRWHKYIDREGKISNIFEETLRNRQEEVPTYYPNGAIYVFKSDILRKGAYYSEKSYAYLMPRKRSVDIDTIDDFEYAEFLMRR
ncbi:MAG: acylneuraminate cytidylyltransferase family protein [Amphritea sp.]|nr:acylneuraminate cytidylyltransferase family protein [Amphritea sp.]